MIVFKEQALAILELVRTEEAHKALRRRYRGLSKGYDAPRSQERLINHTHYPRIIFHREFISSLAFAFLDSLESSDLILVTEENVKRFLDSRCHILVNAETRSFVDTDFYPYLLTEILKYLGTEIKKTIEEYRIARAKTYHIIIKKFVGKDDFNFEKLKKTLLPDVIKYIQSLRPDLEEEAIIQYIKSTPHPDNPISVEKQVTLEEAIINTSHSIGVLKNLLKLILDSAK